MAWCPKCKNEYRDGITVCADCGVALVDEMGTEELKPIMFGDEAQMEELKKFLTYNKLQGVTVRFDEKENVYELLVQESDEANATKMIKLFMKELEKLAESMVEEAVTEEPIEEPVVYQSSMQKAEDNQSSAWTLLGLGTIGLVVMVLGVMGIIPLRIGNSYLFYGVMIAIFILFIVMGFVSMKNAKVFKMKAKEEDTLRETLVEWCKENLKKSDIDANIADTDMEEELLYFKRFQLIKDRLNQQFINLDQAFLDQFIDTYVYELVYEKDA